ncbi:hypothetical protein Hanom_Chr04g00365561 [Helianthus anomalus]
MNQLRRFYGLKMQNTFIRLHHIVLFIFKQLTTICNYYQPRRFSFKCSQPIHLLNSFHSFYYPSKSNFPPAI